MLPRPMCFPPKPVHEGSRDPCVYRKPRPFDPSLHQLMIEVGDKQGLSVLGSLARSDIESKALEGVQGAPRRQLMEYENSERLSEDFYGGLGRLQLDLLRSVSRAACHGKPGPLQVRCRARTHAIHCLSRG
jgi:hypothetical protein